MSILASADAHTLWEITLGMGVVVIGVVIVLMILLLSFVADVERGAGRLLDSAGEVAGDTHWISELAHTGRALDDLTTELSIQRTYLRPSGGRR
jgi:hypothetical protein